MPRLPPNPPRLLQATDSTQRTAPRPTRTLVVGYGNELRTDDGAGPAVARVVESWDLPGVDCIVRHQLTPELAETLSLYQRVIFVDALPARQRIRPRLTPLQPCPSPELLTHSSSPDAILALARLLYHRCPDAWILAVPAFSFAFGQELSARTRKLLPDALDCLRDLLSPPAAAVTRPHH